MKRFLAVCLALLMLLPAAVCAEAAGELTEETIAASLDVVTPEMIARFITEAGCGRDALALERLDTSVDEETLDYYLTEIYGVDTAGMTGCAIYRAGGAEAFEIAVLRMGSEKEAKKAAQALADYTQRRAGDFAGYEPEQAEIAENAMAAVSEYGDAVLLLCEDPENAEAFFQASYSLLFRWPFDPPEDEYMTPYDTAPILAAWESGDSTDLSEKDAAILDMAGAVMDQCVTDDMTDYEKERALYKWVTENVRYDQSHYDPLAKPDPDSYTPYGPLHNGKGVCLGYASTFQLLMDMAGVECITVMGAAYHAEQQNHAWNMVRLNGQWYCADPTWDEGDPEEAWRYFNVTSQTMAASDHQWDYSAVPEAIARDGGIPG